MLREGLARSIGKPGGNTTGINILATELEGKRREILSELTPNARHIPVLADVGVTKDAQLSLPGNAVRDRGIQDWKRVRCLNGFSAPSRKPGVPVPLSCRQSVK
jgi:hypothetical protein